ncbi:integral membrane protein 2C [Prorops nasuta]|uniref:integral membrane protein 2C n=1 Tax=Prorops nasuta TaxID=863751 RepID=UPI0034CFF3F0
MTGITKIVTEKKPADKMEQPLFAGENEVDSTKGDPEAQNPRPDARAYFASRRSILRFHVTATFLLFLVALMILIIGVISGLYIYKQYARTRMHRYRSKWYTFPYDDGESLAEMQKALPEINFFQEQFEFDLENGNYEKIDVPDFRGGREGRFIHDFNINKTGIIDIDGQCCFVMPLNRQRVLPPRNMYDLLKKMYNGYYEVDTEVVRETMRVVTPPITDFSSVGAYIARECQNLRTYMLEKVNPGSVVKRDVSTGVFGQFAGKNVVEIEILNLPELHEDFKKADNKA